ncbi:MAG: sulfatase-like hydrolase/transferase [Gammaproteobacteria bacterium]
MLRVLIVWFIFCLSSLCFALDTHHIKHVIYVTFDGTRWQDIFVDPIYFPKLWQKHAKKGIFYGAPNSMTTIETASIPLSLPSYHSQLTGKVTGCDSNECGRVTEETFAEKILRVFHLNKREVAIFASWYLIIFASEHKFGVTYTNTGNFPVTDPNTLIPDSVMNKLNSEQFKDRPSFANRYDKYTFAHAMHYLQKYQPLFLWISLDDADEAGHRNNLELYHRALSFYDDVIDRLLSELEKLQIDKETLVIFTTDHGRGNGENWTTHGPEFPESKQTWAFVVNGQLIPDSQEGNLYHYSTLSIRKTIEGVLGVSNI